MTKRYDCIIVGAGSMGMATSYYLAKMGVQTLLIDTHDPPHQLGSHHGETRIIRHAYAEGKNYVPLALRAQELWSLLEQESGETLFTQTGVLSIGDPESASIKEILLSAEEYSLPVEILNAEQTEERWPGIVMPEEFIGCFEPTSGVLFSEHCLKAYRDLALKHGAELLAHTQVEKLSFNADGISVQTGQATYHGEYVIVTAGAWANKLLSSLELELPLQPTRKAIGWFEAAELYHVQQFPAFIFNLPTETYYGFPSFDKLGLKIGCHHGGQKVDPDQVNRNFGDYAEDEAKLRSFLETHLPQAAGQLNKGSVCLYTLTPDEHFIIDSHPENTKLIIAAGFSGHGFKFASCLGESLSQLITAGKPNHDLSMFSLHRFATS